MISIGGIIGSGLFVGSSVAIVQAGPGVLLSYLLAGVLVLLVMRMLAEMAVQVPAAGSFTEYIRLGLGNFAGFVAGWLYWYFWVVALAIESLVAAIILEDWTGRPAPLLAYAILALLTGVNLLATRSYGETEFWLSLLKVGAIFGFVLLGMTYFAGENPAGISPLYNLTANGGFLPRGAMSILSTVPIVVFALVGAEIVTVAAAESNESARVIARLTGLLVVRIALFYLVSIAVIVAIVPWNEIVSGISPFTTALEAMRIPGATRIMSIIVLVASLSCLNSGVYVASRVLFSLSAHRDAPAWLGGTTRQLVPARAVVLASGCAGVVLLASVRFPSEVFAFLVNASGALMLFLYLMLACAQIRFRFRETKRGATEPEIRMWLFPASSFAVVAVIGAIIIAMSLRPDLQSQVHASLVMLGVTAALYPLVRRFSRSRSDVPSGAPRTL